MSSTTTLPTHPDFARMLQVISEQDDSISDEQLDSAPSSPEEAIASLKEAFGHLADPESLRHVAERRSSAGMGTLFPLLVMGVSDPVTVFSSLWADAFLAGVRFQRAGGHLQPEAESAD